MVSQDICLVPWSDVCRTLHSGCCPELEHFPSPAVAWLAWPALPFLCTKNLLSVFRFHVVASKGNLDCLNTILVHGVDITATDAAGGSQGSLEMLSAGVYAGIKLS